MSEDSADIYVQWQQSGIKALSDADRFRAESWEVARPFWAESQYIMWELGLVPEEFIETPGDFSHRNVDAWRDFGMTWVPPGGYREEVVWALEEIDRSNPDDAEDE